MTLALLITAVGGAWAEDTYTVAGNNAAMFGSTWDPTNTANDMTKNGDGTYSITYTNVYLDNDVKYKVVKNHSWSEAYPDGDRVINIAEAGTYTLTIHFNPTTHEVYETMPGEPDVEVTTNAAEEGATFTEATFAMPAYDATAEYELVRDMTVDVDATIADRIRIQKDAISSAYVAVTATELIPTVSDKISGTAVAMTVTTDYTAQLQKKTEGDTPTWADATTLSVGTFRYVITGTGLYDGEITTNEFQLFEGYEVTVPAGEYITYYKDEALYVENENAKLYTIASITESEAVLSSEINVAPALTPLLVFNSSDEAKTFLLIPTTDKTPDNVTAATQFVGTLVATTIPASATGADNYALNGYAFVWVKTAIEVGANKCWLHIASQHAAARAVTRSIVGGNGTTGIDAIENVTIDNEGWYDLQGRKLQAKPNRGGIYIHNGKKVVVRK